ncbi:60S ribosomal protein L31-like [Ursus americanus]|uniref:60S ribosomal protein L31-like n=1 Tax=Ursus americanus TaxID=9643 RepID=UPI001E67B23D|nr:60S ribosomal protein L31-like [Ursus americanus]
MATWPGSTAPEKGGEKKGRSAVDEVVARGYTANIRKRIRGVGFERRARRTLKEIRTFAVKEMGTPGVHVGTMLNKGVWAEGIRNAPHCICVRLSRQRNEDEDSPNKLYTLVTYVPVATVKNLQIGAPGGKKLGQSLGVRPHPAPSHTQRVAWSICSPSKAEFQQQLGAQLPSLVGSSKRDALPSPAHQGAAQLPAPVTARGARGTLKKWVFVEE